MKKTARFEKLENSFARIAYYVSEHRTSKRQAAFKERQAMLDGYIVRTLTVEHIDIKAL